MAYQDPYSSNYNKNYGEYPDHIHDQPNQQPSSYPPYGAGTYPAESSSAPALYQNDPSDLDFEKRRTRVSFGEPPKCVATLR